MVLPDLDIRVQTRPPGARTPEKAARPVLVPGPLGDTDGTGTEQLSWEADLDWSDSPAAPAPRGRRGRRTWGRRAPRLRGADALALLDAGPDAIVAVDQENIVVFFNRGAQALFGYRAKDVLGRSADLLVAPAARGVLTMLR
ncbi:MAG: PAS domain S-box protein, partial [Kineosporiaceae bacterium]